MLKKLNKIKNNEIETSGTTNLNGEIIAINKHPRTDKLINVILCIIIFLIPLLTIPRMLALDWYNIPKYIALIICGVILFICLILKRKELKFDLIDKTALAFLALIIISTIFSINVPKAILGEENRYEGLLSFIVYFLTYYCAKYYFSYNKYLIKFAIATVSISSIIGILQYYNLFPLYYIFNVPFVPSFASATFGNRNFFGSFLSMIVPFFIALYIIKGKKVYFIISLLSFFGILVSMTRSAWVGLVAAIILGIIYIVKNFNREILKRTINLTISCLIIFVFVLMPPKFITDLIEKNANLNSIMGRFDLISEDLGKLFGDATEQEKGNAGAGRIRIWILTLKSISQTPLLGTGPDTLKDALVHNVTIDVINNFKENHTVIDKAHNEYLQIAATIGIPALIIYLAFVAQILAKQKDLFKNSTIFIFIVAIISYLVQAFFNISTIGVAPIFWLLLGAIQNEEFKSEMRDEKWEVRNLKNFKT